MITAFNADKLDDHPANKPTPYAALVLYKSENTVTITHHRINNNQLAEGMPIHPDDVVKNLMPTGSDSSPRLIEPALLVDSSQHKIWHLPRKIAPMWFRSTSSTKRLIVEWPPLLLHKVCAGKLYVFALASNQRPNLDTQLYAAPIANMHTPHDMCCPTHTTSPFRGDSLGETNALIYESYFTSMHRNVDFRFNQTRQEKNTKSLQAHIRIWSAMAKTKTTAPKRVTASMLCPVMTFGEYLNTLS